MNDPARLFNLADFESELEWLHTLITDASGERYRISKTATERLQEFVDGLERTRRFLAFTGNPQTRFRSIHVAGTSGKGAVTVMLAALLHAAGMHTGYHISPYLQIPNEKLVVDGRAITPSGFVHLVRDFREFYKEWVLQGGTLRYAEAWTALTFLWLAQERIDWAVIETSMGGRFDPTNVLPSDLSVITNINYDHIPQLGDTLLDIAGHKAGIIKPGKPALTGVTETALLDIIVREAHEKVSPLFVLGRDFDYQVDHLDESGSWLTVQGPAQRYSDLFLPLAGGFQARNAAVAIAAADLLVDVGGLTLSVEVIQRGLEKIYFPGRLEVVQTEPTVILDAAHNRHKMAALGESLRRLYPGRQPVFVIGILAMKDAAAMLAEILPLAEKVIITQPDVFGKPALDSHQLAGQVRQLAPGVPIEVQSAVSIAIRSALETIGREGLIVVTGSMYLVGEARDYWYPRGELLSALEHHEDKN